MNSEELENRFKIYLNEMGTKEKSKIAESDAGHPMAIMAILFGTDEVVLDASRKLITLPAMEPLACETIESAASPDWYALCQNRKDRDWHLVLGYGDPYGPQYKDVFPNKDGLIFAT